jgi:hypothetical protein
MSATDVVMVRVYLADGRGHPESLLKRLREWGHIRGATVFEGVRGFGDGKDTKVPVVVEFFEEPDKAEEVLALLDSFDHGGHVVYWNATAR